MNTSDDFLDATLTWFDDPDPRSGTAWEKGERLAKLITHCRTLLVLDGLESLQNPTGPQEGRVREPSLQAQEEAAVQAIARGEERIGLEILIKCRKWSP
jgi:hypothetical protein